MSSTLLYLLTLLVLLAIPVAFIERLLKKQKERFFPYSDKLPRPPGYSASQKRDEIKLHFISYLLGCIFIGYLASVFLFMVDSVFIKVFGGLLICAEIYLLIKCKKLFEELNKWSLGYAGELAVGQSLNQLMLNGYHVFHDLEVESKNKKKFNLDHVIVGGNGVFCIETKAKTKPKASDGSKVYKVEYNGNALFYEDKPNIPVTRDLKQAKRQANWLHEELTGLMGENIEIIPVLVVPGWEFKLRKDQNKMNVKLLNHNSLASIPKLKTGIKLSDKKMSQIVFHLKKKTIDLDMNRGRWED
jgi:hypothetical protein